MASSDVFPAPLRVGRRLGSQPDRLSPLRLACLVLAILLVALSVGLDNFAAAIGIGLSGIDARLRIQVATIFGLLEGGMPILGLLIGRTLAGTLGGRAHSVGGSVLAATGIYGLVAAWRERAKQDTAGPHQDRRVGHLLLVGVALSIDNLIVGFALGTYHVSFAVAAVVIAAVSVSLSMVGLELGSRLGERIGEYSEFVGGAVLVAVGAAIGFGVL